RDAVDGYLAGGPSSRADRRMLSNPRVGRVVEAGGMRRLVAALGIALVAATLLGSAPFWLAGMQVARAGSPPLVGFSFSPRTAEWLGEKPEPALTELLSRLTPDLVRLPIYWDTVEPRRDAFDFSSPDGLLNVVRHYNSTHLTRPAHVVLEVGMRNMGFPELYIPSWVPGDESIETMTANPEYMQYLNLSVTRYRRDPLLYSWQLENEPLDNVPTTEGTQVDIPGDVLQDEKAALVMLDPNHEVVITTYNSSTLDLDMKALSPKNATGEQQDGPQPVGHPLEALQLGDALGMDLYVVTSDTSLEDATARVRTDWKKAALSYWASQARAVHKSLWITEMQGAPWPGETNFTPDDLLYSARLYRTSTAGVILLWGVESWLTSPKWIDAGVEARRIVGV
ncbi:MAG TPA: hypothetical protein VGR61_07585, partial [Candidatus Dormibacteraeota bacterium]|nr:hypothetical protein [Candidatus Dormibacteraeota bacterium]